MPFWKKMLTIKTYSYAILEKDVQQTAGRVLSPCRSAGQTCINPGSQ